MKSSASAPELHRNRPNPEARLEEEHNDPLKARPGLLAMVEWYIGPEQEQTPHEENVTQLIENLKVKVQRRLEVPDWAIAEPVYDTDQVKERAIGARSTDTLFPMWVKERKDFQRIFNRFNEKEISINKRVLVPIRKHPEERSDDDVKVIMKWVKQFDSLCHLNSKSSFFSPY